jgi:hypothetical protein
MIKVCFLFISLFLVDVVHAADPVESSLSSAIETTLSQTVRCKMGVVAIGSGSGASMGKEMTIWWKKRGVYKNHIDPLFTFIKKQLKADKNFNGLVSDELLHLKVALMEDNVFRKCPEKTDQFFLSIENYIEFLMLESAKQQ